MYAIGPTYYVNSSGWPPVSLHRDVCVGVFLVFFRHPLLELQHLPVTQSARQSSNGESWTHDGRYQYQTLTLTARNVHFPSPPPCAPPPRPAGRPSAAPQDPASRLTTRTHEQFAFLALDCRSQASPWLQIGRLESRTLTQDGIREALIKFADRPGSVRNAGCGICNTRIARHQVLGEGTRCL